jgi:hypothetical protein
MGLTASLIAADVRVTPGQEAVSPVQVRNTGPVVDQFTAEVLGPAARWTVVEPPVLNLFPGDVGEVLVRFQPPRSPEALAGAVPFGVRFTSAEDPQASWVEEGTVNVEPFTDMRAVLRPTTSKGRRRGKHQLDVENLGNIPLDTEIQPTDPENRLRFKLNRPRFMALAGTSTLVRIVAVPRKRFMRGPDKNNPFQVLVVPGGAPELGADGASVVSAPAQPINVDGSFLQRSLLPRWLVPALIALLALAIIAAGLWFALLKPTIKSLAKEQAAVQNSAAAANAEQAKQQAQQAQQKADQAASAAAAAANPGASAGAAGNGNGSTGTGGANDPNALNQPVDFRIQSTAPARTDGGFNLFTFPGQANKPLDITDLQLQNPFGDSGIIELRRGNTTVWLRFGLDNFRDYDDHFVVPIHFNKGDVLTFAVSCKAPGPGRTQCTPAVSISGRTTKS